MGIVLGGEMQEKVAVHSVLGNHGVAKCTFIWTVALRFRRLCPHADGIAQLGAPQGLMASHRKQCVSDKLIETIILIIIIGLYVSSSKSSCYKYLC